MLSKIEFETLKAIADSEYADNTGYDDRSIVGHDVWTFSVTDEGKNRRRIGALGSLTKKGYVECIDDYPTDTQDQDGVVCITQAGFDALQEALGGSGGDPDVPVVGEGATHTLWTDAKAHTVVRVSASGKTAWIQRDKVTLLNGANSGEDDALVMTPGGFAAHTEGAQRYEYERDYNGSVLKVTRRVLKTRDGEKVIWKPVGAKTQSPGNRVTFDGRFEHYDYNF
jgi:hypothetical protein